MGADNKGENAGSSMGFRVNPLACESGMLARYHSTVEPPPPKHQYALVHVAQNVGGFGSTTCAR
jgi:hypothetical protein